MKRYEAPKLTLMDYTFQEEILSLNQWLKSNGLEDAGISTYIITS